MLGVFLKKLSKDTFSIMLVNGTTEIPVKDIIPAKMPIY